jgi:hypothetical protein
VAASWSSFYLRNSSLALYALTQVPSILRPVVRMSSRVSILHLAVLRGMDGCRSSKKASDCSRAESSRLRI